MSRPKKIVRDSEHTLADKEIYRLIKQHPEVKACKSLTEDQIRAVFRAYRDIMYTALKTNEVRIKLPYVGTFFATEIQGWGGGYMNYRKDFSKGSPTYRDYFPPKPNYSLMRFEFNKQLRNTFREETTQAPLSDIELKEARRLADIKEKERLERLNE